jgi:hypothetical protein
VATGLSLVSVVPSAAGAVASTPAPPDWAAPVAFDLGNHPKGISCPSTGLCVAVDSAGNVLVSTNPNGDASTWSMSNVDGSNVLSGMSFTLTSLCVTVDRAGNV